MSTCSAVVSAAAAAAADDADADVPFFCADMDHSSYLAAVLKWVFDSNAALEASLTNAPVTSTASTTAASNIVPELTGTKAATAVIVGGVIILLILTKCAKKLWGWLTAIGADLKEAAKIAVPVFFFATLYSWATARFPAIHMHVFWCYDTVFYLPLRFV